MMKVAESTTQMKKYRDLVSSRLRNYTCADDTMESSEPIDLIKVDLGDQKYDMDVYFNTPGAKIWVVHDFITDEECDILERTGRPILRRATVAAEDGSSIVSNNRKANQASYNIHHSSRGWQDPLYPLYDRAMSMVNMYAGYELEMDGQEDFTIIQYDVDDQYTPHCDGQCSGEKHNPGGRVATAVLYCTTAIRGGATSFTKADVFIKPKKGMATFFTYKGLDGFTDDGYTEHSGCPVLEGEKWVTTVWMRDGVSKERPWTAFDPNGIPVMDPNTNFRK